MTTSTKVLMVAVLMLATAAHALGQEMRKVPGGGGLNVAVYEAGDPAGPAIVFLHGFLGSHLVWGGQLSGGLADEYRLIAVDLRGHGASDKPLQPEAYTNSALWAEDVAAVIREHDLDRPVLVGWSYGGYIISDYLRMFGSEAIGGLVFVGAVTKAGTEEAQAFLQDELLEIFGGVLSPDLQTSIASTRAFLPLLTAEPLDDETHEVALAGAMMVPPEVRLAMFSRELDNDDILRSVDVPTLVVHGRDDRVVRVSAAEHIAATVPGAELLVYDGIGHAPFMEDPERFNGDLREFVRAVRREPSQ
jgi:pimeloyl-ACP methyl ester carboxylesterase